MTYNLHFIIHRYSQRLVATFWEKKKDLTLSKILQVLKGKFLDEYLNPIFFRKNS